MKYTTKSGKELPPEVVEVIENEQKLQNYKYSDDRFGLFWKQTTQGYDFWQDIYDNKFTEFYKLYPKKDYDSYGNEIVKGEVVEVSDYESRDWLIREYFGIAEKAKCKYIIYGSNYNAATSYKFCRKIQIISATEVLKSELQSQMNDLLKQAKEIEAKINEL